MFVPIFTSFGIENASLHSGRPRKLFPLISLSYFFLFHDPRVSTRGIASLYYNYEKYPLSPLKPRSMALIGQYLPNISDPVYSVHQSFMWFLWLNWRKSTFYPVTAPKDSKCWPIVTSSMQEPAASNCDVTITDCSRVVAMDSDLKSLWKTCLCQVFQHSGKNLWSREMFVKWRHD